MKGRNVKRPKILFVAQDIGAFNALVPRWKMRRRWKVLAVYRRFSPDGAKTRPEVLRRRFYREERT